VQSNGDAARGAVSSLAWVGVFASAPSPVFLYAAWPSADGTSRKCWMFRDWQLPLLRRCTADRTEQSRRRRGAAVRVQLGWVDVFVHRRAATTRKMAMAPEPTEEHAGAHDHIRLPCAGQPLLFPRAAAERAYATCASAESLLQGVEAHGGFKRGEDNNAGCPRLSHAHSVAEDQAPAHTMAPPMGMPMEAQMSRPLTSSGSAASAQSSDKELKAPETSRYQLFVKAMTAKLKAEGPDCHQVPVPYNLLTKAAWCSCPTPAATPAASSVLRDNYPRCCKFLALLDMGHRTLQT